MACTKPWLSGRRGSDDELLLPCGQCMDCRLDRARQWGVRIMHEASQHERNSFITLTYDDAHLPVGGSLDKRAFPDFIERLRKRRRKVGKSVRYYHCGEYGEKRRRPHYHAVLFGEDFSDCRAPFERTGSKFPEWIAPELMELWPLGQSLIGSVTMESAVYVAKYMMPALSQLRYERGSRSDYLRAWREHYGERTPEFATMSRRPGIGASWLERYVSDVYPSDEVVLSGTRVGVPRYYDKRLEKRDPALYAQVVGDRKAKPFRKGYERTAERLHVREVCTEAKLTFFKEREV